MLVLMLVLQILEFGKPLRTVTLRQIWHIQGLGFVHHNHPTRGKLHKGRRYNCSWAAAVVHLVVIEYQHVCVW